MTAGALLGEVHARSWGLLLGQLIRATRRPDLAEDALADAFAQAAEQWVEQGVPDNPAGWLATVARRRLVDAQRGESRRAAPEFRAAILRRSEPAGPGLPGADMDERIPLLFMATHPALAEDVRPALALRFVLGVPTEVIARLFLVPIATMAARLTRAKRRLATTGIALEVPDPRLWPDRLDDVVRSIYLAFTAGYAPGRNEVLRVADAGDAVRLAVLAADLLPGEPAPAALAALLRLHHARRDARVGPDGNPVLLAQQDRTRWHADEIADGLARLGSLAPGPGYPEELRLQALIAAFHATAVTAADTDWVGIARAYRRLEALTGSPVVRLNRAVAEGEAVGPVAGLALLRAVGERLPDNHRVELVRAELLRRDGRSDAALTAYAEALVRCPEGAERRHIAARLESLQSGKDGESGGSIRTRRGYRG